MPDLEKALKSYAIDEYYGKAFDLVLSGKARDAFDLDEGARQDARALRPAPPSARACCCRAG